jgi:glycosyltransferase involved in cell wall biosynthesis
LPRVTVVMATYNWAPVLPHSIASVLDQTFPDFELLVVGDACTDESAEVVVAVEDPRVQWHNLPVNMGHQWGPNNEGIRRAEGEFIAYLGHDDLWLPSHLDSLVAALDAGAGLVHGQTLTVSTGEPLAVWPPAGWTYEPGAWVPPTTVGHRRALADSVGGWRAPGDSGGIDPEADLWRRMSARAEVRSLARLSSVKLPAATRHRVYRERPSHEQQYWLERIRASADPEAELRRAVSEPYPYAAARHSRWTSPWDRAHWSIKARWRKRRGHPPVTAAERHHLRRRFKGLEP